MCFLKFSSPKHLQIFNISKMHFNRTVHIRHLCVKITIFTCHRCLIFHSVEKMNTIKIYTCILITRGLCIKGNFGIPTLLYFILIFLFHGCLKVFDITFRAMTFWIKKFSIMTLSFKEYSIMAFSITTLSIVIPQYTSKGSTMHNINIMWSV
jgi:hypothetical protein